MKSGFVGLLGEPNVGKSTLVNALLGEHLAIVSPKPQTTRTRLRGILGGDGFQIVLVDTPGLSQTGGALHRAMRKTTNIEAASADVLLLVVDVSRGDANSITSKKNAAVRLALSICEQSSDTDGNDLSGTPLHCNSGQKTQVVIALNKTDKLSDKGSLLAVIKAFSDSFTKVGCDVAVVPISALRSKGLDSLRDELVAALPEGPPCFPEDAFTQSEKSLCEELIREQALMLLGQEVPHGIAVIIEEFLDQRDDQHEPADRDDSAVANSASKKRKKKREPIVELRGRIYVERESHKGIVVGRGGARIKDITKRARINMERLLGCKVFLRMDVAVDSRWTRSDTSVKEYGIGIVDDDF